MNLTGRQTSALKAIAVLSARQGDAAAYQEIEAAYDRETFPYDVGTAATFARSVNALKAKGLVYQGITWKIDGLKRFHVTAAGRDLAATL